jgi:hypothetical protein
MLTFTFSSAVNLSLSLEPILTQLNMILIDTCEMLDSRAPRFMDVHELTGILYVKMI